jgi:hypothetical protein
MKRHPKRLAFVRDGIDGVCRQGTPDVCRRRRRSSACVAEEEDRGERVATETRGESAALRCDVVRATSTAFAEARRSRRTCVVAQRPRRLDTTTVEA